VKPYLPECLDSVLHQQTEGMIEVVAVDDGSEDGSGDVLREYAAKDARVVTMEQANTGVSAARNHGLGKATGEYVLFLDADDLLEEGALDAVVNRMSEDRLDVLAVGLEPFFDTEASEKFVKQKKAYYQRCGDYANVCGGRELFASLMENKSYFTSVCGYVYRRAYLAEAGASFDETLPWMEDSLFLLPLLLGAKRAGVTGLVCVRRRYRAGSAMHESVSCHRLACEWRALDAIRKAVPAEEGPAGSALRKYQKRIANVFLKHAEAVAPEELHKAAQEIAGLHADALQMVFERCFALKNELKQTQKKARAQGKQIVKLEKRLENVYASTTWKVGRAMTFIPRKLKTHT
jgi:glycosyltransferase involved in cell wall biosynthesis